MSESSDSSSNDSMDLNQCQAFELKNKVHGIGVTLSNRIVNERTQNGVFKTWDDVRQRVHGVGMKTVNIMQNHGVIVCEQIVEHFKQKQNKNKNKGFNIHYVDLGPATRFPNKFNPFLYEIQFKVKQNQKHGIVIIIIIFFFFCIFSDIKIRHA